MQSSEVLTTQLKTIKVLVYFCSVVFGVFWGLFVCFCFLKKFNSSTQSTDASSDNFLLIKFILGQTKAFYCTFWGEQQKKPAHYRDSPH